MEAVHRFYTGFVLPQKRKLKFLTIGFFLYLLNAGLQYLVKEKLNVDAGLTNVYVTLLLYVLQFILNAVYTWGDRAISFKQNLKRAGKYVPIKCCLWGINTALNLWLLSLGLHYQAANAIAVLGIMVINYFVFDRVIFTKK
jgi:putative flippase GtrA